MEHRHLFKQMVEMNKASFENSFETMAKAYEQNKEMAETFLSQSPLIPEEGKKAYSDWLSAMRNGADDFKKMVDENYGKVEAYFDDK
jgi:hypothetical protein